MRSMPHKDPYYLMPSLLQKPGRNTRINPPRHRTQYFTHWAQRLADRRINRKNEVRMGKRGGARGEKPIEIVSGNGAFSLYLSLRQRSPEERQRQKQIIFLRSYSPPKQKNQKVLKIPSYHLFQRITITGKTNETLSST